MGRRIWLRGHVDRQSTDDDGPIRFVAATEGEKADGLDLQMDRLNLDRFRANPVVLYAHEYMGRDALPIGRAEDVFTDDGRLLADVVFDTDDDFAAEIDRKYRGGFLNGVSVGFDTGRVDEDGVPDWWEMMELSAVPVPLDPDALVESGRALIARGSRLGAAMDEDDDAEDDQQSASVAARLAAELGVDVEDLQAALQDDDGGSVADRRRRLRRARVHSRTRR